MSLYIYILPIFLFLAIPLLIAGKKCIECEQKYSRKINIEVMSGFETETRNLHGGSYMWGVFFATDDNLEESLEVKAAK